MKKDKSASTKRGRNFNIVLTVVALVLILAVGGFATYSWVDKSTSLDIELNGDIQRVPGGNAKYYHQVKLEKGKDEAISLKNYVDKASDMVLRPVSSANGKDFFMKTEEKVGENSPSTFTRAGNTSDRNVSYVSFDFDVTSDTNTGIYFDNGLGSDNTPDTENHPRPSFTFEGSPNDELESVRVAIQVNDGTPMIFSKSGGKNTGISDINGNTSETAPRIKAFSECIFGEGNSIFSLKKDTKTKVRITIWLEGTYKNLGEEYQLGKTLNMKLMLTTPWSKAAVVKVCDKTANSMFNGGSGDFYLVGGTSDTKMTKITEDGINYWKANITGNQDSLTFKYVDGSTNYTWTASGRGENSCYYIFDCDPAYGVWGTESFGTETIDISQILIDGTQLITPTVNGLDSHIKVSTDGENYYRAAYNTNESKWYVNIDKDYLDKENPKLYIQYYNDDSALTAKWNATDGRPVINETTKERAKTYYLIDTDGKTTDYSTGSWTDTYNIYFYDGTAQQIITDMMKQASEVVDSGITFEYIAYPADPGKENVSGDMIQDEYRFVADKKLKYSDKINRVVFTLSRPTANGDIQKVTYTWDGDGKVNKDIYYTANSYTKD